MVAAKTHFSEARAIGGSEVKVIEKASPDGKTLDYNVTAPEGINACFRFFMCVCSFADAGIFSFILDLKDTKVETVTLTVNGQSKCEALNANTDDAVSLVVS